jgi:hypothetical protein
MEEIFEMWQGGLAQLSQSCRGSALHKQSFVCQAVCEFGG